MTTAADVHDATEHATAQRLHLLPLLRLDLSKVPSRDADACGRAQAAAMSDPVTFDAMLTHPAIAKLFACGALYFGKAA